MEISQKYLKEAIKNIQIADHMIYVTFPLINEKRLLLKTFEEIYKSIINCIYSLLYYEKMLGRIIIYENKNDNLETFFNIAKKYNLTNQQLKKIKEIIDINNKHEQSAIEFVKKEKLIMMSDTLRIRSIDLFILKEYLLVAKEFLMLLSKKYR